MRNKKHLFALLLAALTLLFAAGCQPLNSDEKEDEKETDTITPSQSEESYEDTNTDRQFNLQPPENNAVDPSIPPPESDLDSKFYIDTSTPSGETITSYNISDALDNQESGESGSQSNDETIVTIPPN